MSEANPDVSVIICAYTVERWADLQAAVDSIHGQAMPSYEIILVIDHNPALLQMARASNLNATVIENTEPKGVSGARNSGFLASRGRLIAFLDDDAVARGDWLSRLCDWCKRPGVLGVGGKASPVWLVPRPPWFPDEFGWALGYSHKGLPLDASEVRNVFGSGMCFRREVFETVGSFRTGIGRINRVPLGCEETEFCIRVGQQMPSGKLIYEPAAVVDHKISAGRASWTYFLARCYSEGLSKAIVANLVGAHDGLSSERHYTIRVLPAGVARGLGDTVLRSDWSGVARAAAIAVGLLVTVAGYLVGSCQILLSTNGLRPSENS